MNSTSTLVSIDTHSSTVPIDVLFRKILLGLLLLSLSIFTVCGNLLVLYAIRTEKRLRTVSNLFILSLAFADLVVGLLVMPLSAANIIAGQWPFSYFVCQMWLSVDYVASTASIFNLVLLSLDRYWAVVHPLLYLQNRTRKRATNFIVIVWFISLLWAPAVIFWSSVAPEHSDVIKPHECDTSFRSNKIFKTLTALVNFYLPLVVMMFISCRIMVAIRSRSTMEFGRRISSATQRQMRQDRAQAKLSFTRPDRESNVKFHAGRLSSDDLGGQAPSVSIVINPFESRRKTRNIPKIQSDDNTESSVQTQQQLSDDTESLSQYSPGRSYSTHVKPFSFAHFKPMSILFPSLTSIRENEKRNSAELPRRMLSHPAIRCSLSVSNDMKYIDGQANTACMQLDALGRAVSTSSILYDACPPKKEANPRESVTSPMPTTSSLSNAMPLVDSSNLSPPTQDDEPLTTDSSNKMTIVTFLDYIINPSLSSSLQKELKAARQLGMLVGVFTVTWLPYFILFLVVAWCQHCVSDDVYTASIWLGYLNSTLNPLIYPLCNTHFRRAFRKTFYCQHAKTKLPNLNALRDLQALHSIHRRR